MQSQENATNQKSNRKYILYIIIVIFIFSLTALVYRLGVNLYEKYETIKEEERLNKEKIEKGQQEIRDKIQQEQEKQREEANKQKIDVFNSNYEFWSGTQISSVVTRVLDKVITNNNTNNEHQIEVVFDGNTYGSDANNIRNIKDSLKNFNGYNIQQYEIILAYDENGYINKITIETK